MSHEQRLEYTCSVSQILFLAASAQILNLRMVKLKI